ncbi:alpha/beta fold hydrolase [Aquimarina sp. AD10]|uniref:alpha/beta fold hydrolase n=1 Tax=Aquimarina sp. AD10 TaxID=1714849 RepID=UPI001F360CFE|nr:alpha/beta hydrolase [Aquimarina sp. AD10]
MDVIINKHTIRLSKDPELLDPNKSTIIFLHDSLGCIKLWKDFPEKLGLETGLNVLAYDRQGYGESSPFTIHERSTHYLKNEAELLEKLLDQLGLTDVLLFGHSDGGSIAILAAALFPKRIKGIITEGAHVFVEKETITGIKKAVEAYTNTNLKEKLIRYHGNKTDAVFRMWTQTWLSDKFQSWNIESYLSQIQCPSLIIQGEKDEYGTLDQVTSITTNTKGESTSLILPNIGHTPHKENAKLVIAKTKSFIQEVS